MIHIKVKYKSNSNELIKKVWDDSITSLNHAAASVRMIAMRSIRKRKGASPRGAPPHTHTGLLKKSIVYNVDKKTNTAIVGPSKRIIGPAGMIHEFGGLQRGNIYSARPFMGPAFDKIKPRLPEFWASSVNR